MEVNVLINEVRVKCQTSKTTTCADVINMATTLTGYALYERGYGVESIVSMTTNIQKLIRSWGADKDSYSLVLRQNDKMESKMAIVSKAKRKLQRLRSLLARQKKATQQTNHSYINANLQMNNCVNKIYNKNVMVTNIANDNEYRSDTMSFAKVRAIDEKSAKFELLERYITESSVYVTDRVMYPLPPRTRGDGAEDSNVKEGFDNITGVEAFTMVTMDRSRDLDEAFVSDDSCSEFSDCDLNECFLHETDDTQSSESAFEDDSDCESISELNRNIADFTTSCVDVTTDNDVTLENLQRLRALFSKGDLEAYVNDADVDSFMKTVLYDMDNSDDGVGSLNSDEL